jgi:hypothetical protein
MMNVKFCRLGGNPICSKENSAQTKSANQQMNCRYNSSKIAIGESNGHISPEIFCADMIVWNVN